MYIGLITIVLYLIHKVRSKSLVHYYKVGVMNINVNELKSWIGNDEIAFDEVSQSLEARFRATLDEDPGNPQKGEIASSGLHWALAPAVVKSSLLGKDSNKTISLRYQPTPSKNLFFSFDRIFVKCKKLHPSTQNCF